MQEFNPNLTDLLLLDDEQYKDKFNCDYTKQVRRSLWPEGYVQEIRSYYFSHLLDFKNKDREVRILDYAKEILLDTSCYNIRVHNMIYILLATMTTLNTDSRGRCYMVKPCQNGMQIMSLRGVLINDEAKSRWYNHNKALVRSTDIKLNSLNPLPNAPAASENNKGWLIRTVRPGTYAGISLEANEHIVSDGSRWVKIEMG